MKVSVSLRIFFSSQINIKQFAIFGRNKAVFIVFFQTAPYCPCKKIPWQLTDYGKFSLVSSLPLKKINLDTYQGLLKLPQRCSRVTMEKEFSPENSITCECSLRYCLGSHN